MTALAAEPNTGVRFTPEQREAIEDRGGSALLAANAGSGKTAVMVERFVEAVRHDGIAVGAVLALTFTEKAAGELRDRVRRRFTALGEVEHAREAEAAWIGTIHGFCARILRARPLAAGLDPRFTVLDEAAARRLAERAFETALEAWAAAGGAPSLDIAAAYGPALRDIVLAAYETLRSRGEPVPGCRSRPRSRRQARPSSPPPAPPRRRCSQAPATARRSRQPARRWMRSRSPRESCRGPATSTQPGSAPAAKALDEPACAAYRAAWEAYRAGCADHHGRAALILIDGLLDRFGGAFEEAKAARAAIDFSDLELRVRDLLTDPAARRSWAERFELIMVDEFQDTNRLQLDVLEALERDNLFAVGDEFQSIYRFRHADVTIFRERRDRLGADRVRRLERNFRSRKELLDVLNAAFAPELGERFAPLVGGAPLPPALPDGGAAPAVRPRPGRGEPAVELLITDTAGGTSRARRARPHGARAPAVAARRGAARRAPAARGGRRRPAAGRRRRARPRDSARCRCSSRRSRSRACRPTSSAAAATGRRSRSATGSPTWCARQPADEEALLARSLRLLRRRHRRARPARAGRRRRAPRRVRRRCPMPSSSDAGSARERRPSAHGCARSRALRRRARAGRAASRPRCCSSGPSPPAMTSPCWRVRRQRRLANLRKLMRLAREYERAEGPTCAVPRFRRHPGPDRGPRRRGGTRVRGLDAMRLMTIHRAEGLEFPVVCVTNIGRAAGGNRERLLLGREAVGLRLSPIGGGEPSRRSTGPLAGASRRRTPRRSGGCSTSR